MVPELSRYERITSSLPSLVLAGLLILGGCSDGDQVDRRAGVPFDSVFNLAGTIVLEESLTDPIVDLKHISVAPDGRIVFADHRAARVRVFDENGRAIVTFGRHGDGPGEFQRPLDARFVGGEIFVTDPGGGRITRYDSNFELDTILTSPGGLPADIVSDGTDLVLLTGAPSLVLKISRDGEVQHKFPTPDSSAYNVPYWGSILDRSATVLGNDLVVATNLLYPLWRHDLSGGATDSLGVPPPTFIAAGKPERGRFAGAAQAEVSDWLRTFSVLDRIETYRNSVLLVVHGRFEPYPGEPWNLVHTTLDAYDSSYRKFLEDIMLPGRLLGADDYIYILLGEPPDAWTIGRYTFRPTSD
jgi:hypothetical protein